MFDIGLQRAPSRFFCESYLDRRSVICGGGAAAFLAILSALLGPREPVVAAPISGGVPELDRVAVRIVVEDFQFAVAPGKKLEGLALENYGWGLSPDHPPGRTLISEFGLSMHVESRRGSDTRHVLVDFGFTPEALNNNLDLLGIRPNEIDALVLSHGHYDHFGGLAGFLKANTAQLKPKLPFYVGGEDGFCARQWVAPPVKGDFGVIDRPALEAANLTVMVTPEPALVGGHGFTSGRIATQSFEKLKSPTAMKLGLNHGSGCDPKAFSEAERAKGTIPDQFNHEIATAFNLKGKGLIVLTSCSHRGVVNAVQQAQAASGVKKVHAIIGGLHLAPYPEDYVVETIEALRALEPDYVFPLHCSGEVFYDKARAAMPGKVVRAFTGTRLLFDA